ncbi:MAG: T9SS type A sorting domain-containing protein [Bacteroidetes bacterium]|nr:T9SS type A sorting domain-containing protein [Bacteroidota bacterium]
MRKLIFTLLLLSSSFLLKAQVYVEDFESAPYAVTSSGTPGFNINTRIYSSITTSDTSFIDAPNSISYLETDPIDCSFNFFVKLNFKQICKIEFFDNATIEISTDGGVSWIQLVDDAGGANNNCSYLGTGLFRTQGSRFQEASYAAWQPGQSTIPDNTWWQTEIFDVSNLAGNNPDVRFRFKLADGNNSGGSGRNGWAIDDLVVTATLCETDIPNVYPLPPNYSGTVYNLGPFNINAAFTDASLIASATLNYTVNGIAEPGILMTNISDSTFNAQIPDTLANGDSLAPGDSICYYIEVIDASFCANINYLPGPGPSDLVCFDIQAGISFPYCDIFDITTNLWAPNAANLTSVWELGTPAFGATSSAYSAPNSWDINLTTPYDNGALAYLLSPELSFTIGAGAKFEFWRNHSTEATWDGVRVEWTTDTILGPWNVLSPFIQTDPNCVDCENWYTDAALNSSQLPGWEGNSGGWVRSSVLLDAQFNNLPQCWFRFVFTSDGSVTGDGFSIDNFCITLPQPDDVGVSSITQPGTTGPAGNCLDVIVNVKNYGLNNQITFPVTYVVNPGGLTGTVNYTGTLTPGASASVTLPCFNVPVGTYTICAYTSLPGDGNNFNDTICKSSLGIPVLSLTACDDFESGNAGFQDSTNNAAAAQWQLGTPNFGATTGANSGVNAWDINLNNGYGFGAFASLNTPIYDLVGAVNPYLSFFRNQLTAGGEGLRISYNANGSGNWIVLGTVGDPDGLNWYNNNSLNFGAAGWDGSSGGWAESRYYLQNIVTANAITFIQFRFEFISGFNGVPNDGVSIDDLCVKQPGANDVGVTLITEPTPNGPANGTSNVTVQIRNFGTAPQTTIPVAYSLNGGAPVTATFNGTLAPNSITTFSMPTFTVPSGQYDFCAWTELAGDTDNSNDTTCVQRVGVPVIPLSYTGPYNDNFDGPNVGWSTLTPGGATTIWELGTPAFGTTNNAFSPPNSWDVNLISAYGPTANCELYTPIFDLSNAVDAKLSFWRNHNTEAAWDGVRLEYNINGGPWILLGGPGLTAPCWVNWYNQAAIISSNLPAWAGATGGWIKTEATCLNFLDSVGLVQFRFIFTSDASVQIDGFSIDDFSITIPVPLTASPIIVNTNTINNNFIFPGQVVQFSSPISNPGTTPLTSVNATLTINGVPLVTDPISYAPALPSQQNQVHAFSQQWTAAPGVYDVCVITSDPNNGIDLNPFDDTTCITISVFDSVSITAGNPYCNDFESGPQWVSVNALTYNSTINDWELGTPNQTIINGAFSGTNAWTISLDSNYANRDTSGLFTPVFTVDNTKCYKLSFRHKYDTEPFADGGIVEYSVDNATTWQHLGFASSLPTWFNTPFITGLGGSPGLPGWSGTETNWVLAEKEVNFFNSGTVIFRFRFASDNTVNNYEGWAIDDFCFEEITGPCTVGINDPIASGISLGQNYPNPFTGASTVDYMLPIGGNVTITISNVLGQEIAVPVNGSKDAGAHSFTINSRDFGAGIYYYTLEFEGQKITRKLIITE